MGSECELKDQGERANDERRRNPMDDSQCVLWVSGAFLLGFRATVWELTYDSEERWRSEGIQIGGIGTRRGVLGTWFDKDFDPHGPAGPTAFWKVGKVTMPDEAVSSLDF